MLAALEITAIGGASLRAPAALLFLWKESPRGILTCGKGRGEGKQAHDFICHDFPRLSLEFLKENITEPSMTSSFHLNINHDLDYCDVD